MDRPDETSELSVAPSPTLPDDPPAAPGVLPNGLYDRLPPRPLPARAFFPAVSTAEAASIPVYPVAGEPSAPLSADAAFKAIDDEASSRSLSAVETAIADALREIKPHGPIEISELTLPPPTPAANGDLGQTVPRRMLEPRLDILPPAPMAFDRVQFEPEGLPPPGAQIQRPARSYWSIAKRGVRLFAWLVIGWLALVMALIVAFRFVNPPASMLMLQNWLSGQSVTQTWVPFENISPNVVRAVLLSEDGRFCQHAGVDLEAMEDAIENSDGRSRGGSTISMQVVKNLFLWPSKSYIRKAIELPLTFLMELVWSKRRIMEVYLNIAEWGPGIFGIGAASQYHFGKLARNLSVRDAARLAVSLPNPLVRNAGRPGPGLQRLANAIQVRMRLAGSSELSCVLSRRPY